MNDADFQAMVREFVAAGASNARRLAHACGVSVTTVRRWVNGYAIPLGVMRRPVVVAIADMRAAARRPDPDTVRRVIGEHVRATLEAAVAAGHIAEGLTVGDLLGAFSADIEVTQCDHMTDECMCGPDAL